MAIESIRQFYQQRIQKTKESHSAIKKTINIVGTIRLGLVLVAGIFIYYFWNEGFFITSAIFLLFLILFLWLVIKHNKLFEKKVYMETSITSDENELKGIDYNYSAFCGAGERIKSNHPFTLDLDVFGEKSLFQAINRTCTTYGKEILADWFENPLNNKNDIIKRQDAIFELTNKNELRHHFRVNGLLNPGNHSDLIEIRKFVHSSFGFTQNKGWKIATFLMPAFWVVCILLLSFHILPAQLLSVIFLICLAIGESKTKKVNRLQHSVGKKVKIFSGYATLIQIIENENCHSELLQTIRAQFINNDKKASVRIKQLSKLLGDLDIRFNFVARLLLNTVFLWDIRKAIGIENWKEKNAEELENWIKVLGEYDALCSMSTFSQTHPGYIFPEIAENYFEMQGKAIGHPLLHRDTCVKNNIEIPFRPYFMIVTGANMAGKSTYLRTIGVNYLLACIGLPVYADSLTVYPAKIITSLRTSDSLSNNESYFFAELKRLKTIIDELHAGKKLFIILDEILKGTNSVDKQKGSLALVQQFISLNTCGIIATHDLLLGSLEKEFPENIKNMRFEADITNDELYFSYKMKTGIAQNMNACFLMQKMGITV